jgi:RNA polymerase sigma factor (sigma-70 family)
MTKGRIDSVLRQVRRLAAVRHPDTTPDRGLLERFVADRDEACFEALVRRHGPMVLAVCRRVLRHAEDAEDAFQAAFLVLASRAASVRKADSLGSWLHGVAYRVAASLKRDVARRRAREAPVGDPPEVPVATDVSWQDVRVALDEALARLPERLRAPLVLCYLEGKTRDEAARELGWSLGTLHGRLERGRDALRTRLTRRGLTLSAALLGGVLAESASAGVPAGLVGCTARAAARTAVGATAVSARAAALAEGVLRTMFVTRLTGVTLVLFAVAALGTAGLVLRPAAAGSPVVADSPAAAPPGGPPVDRPEAAPKPAAAPDFGPEVKGLRAKVTLAKEKFAVGEAIEVKYVVKNVSKDEQTLWHSGFWPNHQILVKDADGKEPPLTEFGQERRKAFSPGGERTKNVAVKVPPGGEDAAYEPYDLTKLYDLTKTGRYTVQYVYEERQGGWEGRLPSNEAAFEFAASENKERTAEKDGVRFELLVPNTTWSIPANKVGAEGPVALGLRITNTTKKAFRFSAYDTLFPEVRGPDGKVFDYGVRKRRTALRRAADCPLVEPGASVILMLDASLSRMPDDRVLLRGQRPSNPWVLLNDVKPGRYKVRVSYQNDDEQFKTDDDMTVLKDVWTGDVPTPFVEVTVVKPEAKGEKDEEYAASKAVRVGDVEFQAMAQNKRLVAEPGIERAIDLGLRITNRGDKPLTFNLFDAIRPVLKSADGKSIPADGGRNATKPVAPLLIAPGMSETVRWRARLEWPKDQKLPRLSWSDGTGLLWYFDGVGPGRYLLRFEYENTKGEKFWTGKATTNDVEFEIVPGEKTERGLGREESNLQGLWLATELDGTGSNPVRGAEQFRMLVEGDKILLARKGEKREYRFKLDPTYPNHRIDLFPVGGDDRGGPLLGIYRGVQDRLTLSFYKDPAKGRPSVDSAKVDVGFWGLECRHVRESKAVRVDGLEFVALAPVGVAPAPVGGIRDQIDLGLRVTNVSDKPLALSTFDVIRPRLYTADGKELRMDGGRDGQPRPTPPAILAAGASWTWRAQANLRWMKDRNTLMLDGPDGHGVAGFWSFSPLKEGKYRFAVEHANSNARQDDVALWVGKAATEKVDFEIVFRAEPVVEQARHGALKALQDEYEKLRKKFADQGTELPEHKGEWIPVEPASYHMRKITEGADVVHVKFWTAVEGGFTYEVEVEVHKRTSEVRVLKASLSYSQS